MGFPLKNGKALLGTHYSRKLP